MISCGIFWGNKETPENSASNPIPTTSGFNQDSHISGYGTDASRVDSQITLAIPEGQADEVYRYLRDTYVDHSTLLKQAFPELNLAGENKIDVSEFTDQYYDTADLDLYKTLNSSRYRFRINTTDPEDAKSGRELVQIKVTPPGKFILRTEVKFKVKHHKSARKDVPLYNVSSIITLVESEQLDDFEQAFKAVGINPYSLEHILTTVQKRSRVYLDLNDKNFLSFSVDEGYAGKLWARAKYSSVDIGLVEKVYTPASAPERKLMWGIREVVLQDLLRKFPGLTQTTASKYNIVLDQIKNQIPYFEFLLKYGPI